MKISSLLGLPVLVLALPLAGCNVEIDVDAAELRKEFEQALDEVRDVSIELREELLEVVHEQQAAFAATLRELRVKLEQDDELRRKLREKREALERLIADVTNEGDDAWEETRDALLAACDDLGETLREFSDENR